MIADLNTVLIGTTLQRKFKFYLFEIMLIKVNINGENTKALFDEINNNISLK